jgi:hypothetical protein
MGNRMDQGCDGLFFMGTLFSRNLLYFRRNPDPYCEAFFSVREGGKDWMILRGENWK